MTPPSQTVCLCMIVRNESSIIRRCLDSVRPILTHWLIVDTGSTDGTQDIIREYMKGLPGQLHERPWQDFAHNRTEAIALARGIADYIFIIDADDRLDLVANYRLPRLSADSYMVDIVNIGVRYQRIQMVRSALPWRYVGVLHEIIVCDQAKPSAHLPITMICSQDGARKQSEGNIYQRDAATLERALQSETDPFLISRYTFYLAQSYRDMGEAAKSLEAYLRRAEQGFWPQEVFCSLYQAGLRMAELGHDPDETIAMFQRACDADKARAEAYYGASRFCRGLKRYEQGYQLARKGLAIGMPVDGLFTEAWIYDWALLDELAVNAYWCERYPECIAACEKILAADKCPENFRERVAANARFSRQKLAEMPQALADAVCSDVQSVLKKKLSGLSKDRTGNLKVLQRAAQSGKDAEFSFWLAREMMADGQHDQAAVVFRRYLKIPGNDQPFQKSEAMRSLARLQPDRAVKWLLRSLAETETRREIWLDLAEVYHTQQDWTGLLWACAGGLSKTLRTGIFLDEAAAWGFRLHDLSALANSHLGLTGRAVEHGTLALAACPADARLVNNLAFYRLQHEKTLATAGAAVVADAVG